MLVGNTGQGGLQMQAQSKEKTQGWVPKAGEEEGTGTLSFALCSTVSPTTCRDVFICDLMSF